MQLSDEPTPRWKLIFYILGSVTAALGIFLWFFMADGPSNARWLKKEDRLLAVARVASSGVGVKSLAFNWEHGREGLMDPKKYVSSRSCADIQLASLYRDVRFLRP